MANLGRAPHPICCRMGCRRPALPEVAFCVRHWNKAPVAMAEDYVRTRTLVRLAAMDRRFTAAVEMQVEAAFGNRHVAYLEKRIAEALEARGA